jgi:hypothetical protein
MDELIQEVVKIVRVVGASNNNWLMESDLKLAIQRYVEDEIDRRVEERLVVVENENFENGYSAGYIQAKDDLRDAFERALEEI